MPPPRQARRGAANSLLLIRCCFILKTPDSSFTFMPLATPDIPPPIDPGYDGWDMPLHPFVYLQHPLLLLYHPFALLAGALWVWMLIHCIRHDPERNLWLWILFIGNVPAALIYFL